MPALASRECWAMDVNGRRQHRHRQPSQEGYREIVILGETQSVSPLDRAETIRVGELSTAPNPGAE